MSVRNVKANTEGRQFRKVNRGAQHGRHGRNANRPKHLRKRHAKTPPPFGSGASLTSGTNDQNLTVASTPQVRGGLKLP